MFNTINIIVSECSNAKSFAVNVCNHRHLQGAFTDWRLDVNLPKDLN